MKNREEYLKYGHIGTYYGGSAFVGMKVYEIDERNEKIRFMWFYDDKPNSRMTTVTIRYPGAGRPYFMTRGRRIHLDEIIREKHAVAHRADLAECFLDLTHSAISNALEGAQLGGDYKGNMGPL